MEGRRKDDEENPDFSYLLFTFFFLVLIISNAFVQLFLMEEINYGSPN